MAHFVGFLVATTIKLLRLNERDYLPEARRLAFNSYIGCLGDYIRRRDSGESPAELKPAITALQRMQHPTVWREMQRQHPDISDLKRMFDAAPEALHW